jgi:serine/threonine protein kinase
MAPEVVRNNNSYLVGGKGQEYGLGVDLWALGLFLYFFIEGKNPFHNGDLT